MPDLIVQPTVIELEIPAPQVVELTVSQVGVPGSKGDKGEAGEIGPQGIQGLKGSDGAAGLPGAVGLKGDPGDPGLQGSQGLKGDAGAVGPKGDTGETGEIGPVGLTGDTGVQGIQGLKGDKGDTGAAGPIGPAGAKGDPGLGLDDFKLLALSGHPKPYKEVVKNAVGQVTEVGFWSTPDKLLPLLTITIVYVSGSISQITYNNRRTLGTKIVTFSYPNSTLTIIEAT